MHFRCPHCHNAIEVVESSSFKEVECPSCGSHFSLVGDDATISHRGEMRTLGHFQLIEQVGVGAFGSVWKAKDTQLDRTVAIKIPRRDQLDESHRELFFREARAAGQLRHPNIVGIHEVGREGETIFIASEFIDGATLKDWLKAQPLPPKEAAELCAKIAGAVHAAHEMGVVHRDLKPGNVMVDLDGEPHVMDFGLAKRDSGEITMTVDGATLGTPAYMSPEQARGQAHEADRRSDVYSLGVMLFELLTGELPFRGEKRMLLVQIQNAEPPSPRRLNSTVPRDLETICLKCLEKDPKGRYQTAEKLAQDLVRFQTGEPIQARAVGRAERTWRWCKRKPAQATAVVLLSILAVGGPLVAMLLSTAYQDVRQANTNMRQANQEKSLAQVQQLVNADIAAVPAILETLDVSEQLVLDRLRELDSDHDLPISQRFRVSLALLESDSATVVPKLAELLPDQGPAELLVVRGKLKPFAAEIRESLWAVVENPDAEPSQQLRAAAVLAEFAPRDPRWDSYVARLANQLVNQNSLLLSDWVDGFRPIKDSLLPQLLILARDQRVESAVQRNAATNVLADYAADRPDTLTEAIQYADAEQFAVFHELLTKHRSRAIEVLESLMSGEPVRDWSDGPLDPAWQPVAPDAVEAMEQAHGMVAERLAFCQTLPLAGFEPLCERLKLSGYRPRRVRLIRQDEELLVAAVWIRDGQDWRWQLGDAAAIRTLDEELAQQQFQPVDVTAVNSKAGNDSAQDFAAVWLKVDDGEARNRLLVGANGDAYETAAKSLYADGYRRRLAWSVLPLDGGEQLVSGVWGKSELVQETYAEAGNRYTGELHLGLLQTDVQLSPAAKPVTNRQRFEQERAAAEAALAEKPDDVQARFDRAVAAYQLDDLELAATDLAWLIEKQPAASAFRYRALVLARQGKADDAKTALEKGLESVSDEGQRAYHETLVAFYLGQTDAAFEKLETERMQHADDADVLYWLACAAALAARTAEEDSPDHQSLALRLLQEAVEAGYSKYTNLLTDSDLDSLRESEVFQQLLKAGRLDRQFTALWEVSSEYESTELHGLVPSEQLAQARQLIAEGYRPACLAGIHHDENVLTASVWHRPLIPEAAKESLAQRQANAAVALLKLNQGEAVWPYLEHRSDPRGRSYLIHRLAPLDADPAVLIAKLEDESTEVSIRRALLLSLGELASEQYPDESRQALEPKLLDLYKTHPDAGIHAASQWLLRKWGAEESIAQATAALQETEQARAKRETDSPRGWYVNGQGQTMVVVQGGEFLMGSLSTEPFRGSDESMHRKRIGRRYVLSATAVTRAQYRTFQETSEDDGLDLVNNPNTLAVVRTDDSPITGVTWYEAAAYCNWLSKQEGIDEDQWCYERNEEGKFGPKMKPKANYLSLTGYRLPSEAEWEFACRAGATTRRYYGHSDAMLDAYAWFVRNARQRTWPVASKKPNDFGLFDMHGNVWTWCHNRSTTYRDSTEDVEDSLTVEDNAYRVVRGASFLLLAPALRSANRTYERPESRFSFFGFRPARTLTR